METGTRQRVVQMIDFYTGLGFFREEKAEGLYQKIGAGFKFLSDDPHLKELGIDIPAYLDDLWLLSYDKQRVSVLDLEADVCAGNGIYIRVLNEWSDISNDLFKPRNITERWNNQEITVEFDCNGTRHVFRPVYLNDFIDIGILEKVNHSFDGTGSRFEAVAMDQTCFVMLLSAREKATMAEQRGIEFFDFSELNYEDFHVFQN